ncbi:MAG: cysteine hydrolase family protein [Brevefilum sp.]
MKPYASPDNIAEKTQAWLDKIAPYNTHKMQINREACALMIVDMQNFFLEPDSPTYTTGGSIILPNAQNLLRAFRQSNLPVIFTRHVHHPENLDAGIMDWWWEGKCIEGTPESEIVPGLRPLPNEKVVFKHRYSAFYNTDLETVLRCLKIQDIVISGVMTNMCVESTARDAYFRDYRVWIPADGTGSINEEMHLASLMNLALGFAQVTTTEAILAQIGK